MQSLLILGRQPEIGLAELASLYGTQKVRPVGKQAALVDVDPCLLAFDRLGGSVKFATVLSTQPTVNETEIEDFLKQVGPGHAQTMTPGKLTLGISRYGFGEDKQRSQRMALALKKAIQQTGRSVRVVPNSQAAITSAQHIHNRLGSDHGWEIVMLRDGNQTLIGRAVKVQDINSYAQRDQNRPQRDPKVGMLPPKLAQILINLATGPLSENLLTNICDQPAGQTSIHRLDQLLLDPFCGTGVIAQEALLMGYPVLSSDINPRLVEMTKTNIEWLRSNRRLPDTSHIPFDCLVGDATNVKWPSAPKAIASELFLNQPLSNVPDRAKLEQLVHSSTKLVKDFLANIRPQITSGTKLALAIPAWQTNNGQYQRLPLVDATEEIGYNRLSFKFLGRDRLIYARPNQIVARDIIVLAKQ